MAGGSPDQARIAANLVGLLSEQLRGKPCAVYTSDLRVRIKATGLTTYPNVTVVCGELTIDPEDHTGHTVINPAVVVEVQSPSTEDYDRGEKLSHYKRCPRLQHILLVSYQSQRLELWSRQSTSRARTDASGDATVTLDGIGCLIPLDRVYSDPLTSSP